MGGSSGTAVAAALKYAMKIDKPRYIVVLLPDTGRNYLSKIYNDNWMRENGFSGGGKPLTAGYKGGEASEV